ncbi:hypothetical protein F4805DRAFT_132089 [Annulohypoxylon moriforme]|nr:hypothetical protein F4805DRAFT_132089 [Annulohypoxylon moriforme]
MHLNTHSEEMASPEPDEIKETEPAPPAYEISCVTKTPQPATQGRFYFENPTKLNITLAIGDRGRSPPQWFGELQFKCNNVPQLMREGLYWTMDNVSREDGFFSPISPEFEVDFWMIDHLVRVGYVWTRHYFLRDLEQEPPRWIAHFQIHAAKNKTLADFRLDDLSVEDVKHAIARGNPGDRTIYRYSRREPVEAFNAIYDDMPMEGWWPWPRKEKEKE